jgi:hypothetical protein
MEELKEDEEKHARLSLLDLRVLCHIMSRVLWTTKNSNEFQVINY